MNAGMEAEFFLFRPDATGEATTTTHDVGGYFDLAPADLGEDARRAMVDTLEQMGFEVEAAHHEVAHGQHEIDFRYADALQDGRQHRDVPVRREARGDAVRAARVVHAEADLRAERQRHAHAPVAVSRRATNAFWDENAEWELSRDGAALHRRAAATRARHVRDHQSARELVQAARAGLRSAGERRVVDAQPVAADPRSGSARGWARASSCGCRIRRRIRISRSP